MPHLQYGLSVRCQEGQPFNTASSSGADEVPRGFGSASFFETLRSREETLGIPAACASEGIVAGPVESANPTEPGHGHPKVLSGFPN